MTVLLDCCGTNGCTGQVLTIDSDDRHFIEGECDRCHAAFAIPTTKIDGQVKRARLLEHARLPARFADKHFDTSDPHQASAIRKVNQWLAGITERNGKPLALPAPALHSPQGSGKTHLLTWLCGRLITERALSVAFFSTRRLLRELQNFEHAEDQQATWRRAITVQVLALDDLGAQQQTEWRHDQLADLVDERYERELPVLLATNYAPSMWPHMLDRRTASRLAEMTFPVECAGPDRRQQPAAPGTPSEQEERACR